MPLCRVITEGNYSRYRSVSTLQNPPVEASVEAAVLPLRLPSLLPWKLCDNLSWNFPRNLTENTSSAVDNLVIKSV